MTIPDHAPRILSGADLHRTVIEEGVLRARSRVWIATADLKDMHVPDAASAGTPSRRRQRFRPVLEIFDRLAAEGVRFRVIHAALPTRFFRATLERYPRLTGGALELQICPRSHWKIVVVDGELGYCGSANFTGAGLGARAAGKRNLEVGVVARDPAWVGTLERLFDEFWIGDHCEDCRLREVCPDPIR